MSESHSDNATGSPTLNGDRLRFMGRYISVEYARTRRSLGPWLLAPGHFSPRPQKRQKLLGGARALEDPIDIVDSQYQRVAVGQNMILEVPGAVVLGAEEIVPFVVEAGGVDFQPTADHGAQPAQETIQVAENGLVGQLQVDGDRAWHRFGPRGRARAASARSCPFAGNP